MMALVVIPAFALAAAWLMTGAFRRYALAADLLDHPNERSSHTVPTPRGGGIAIVVTTLVSLPFLVAAGGLARWEMIGLGIGGAGVALVGYLDDRRGLAARWRLAAHFLAAAWVIYCFWRTTFADPSISLLVPRWLLIALASLYIVWILNLTNFMDGIDGIAGVEIVSACAGAALIALVVGLDRVSLAPLTVAAATLGFLLWNWPPAKIFMGDTGSGFLGFVTAALSLSFAGERPELFWVWVILFGVFVVDATFTLLRRALRGTPVYQAHRTHAFQHAASRFRSHRRVTLAVLFINCAWLLPLAMLAALHLVSGVVATLVAYLPLIGLVAWLDAGRAPSESPRPTLSPR